MMVQPPVLISYVATFLKPEMLHVYRQVNGVRGFENWVMTRHAQHLDQFPFPRIRVLHKPFLRGFRRLYYRRKNLPVPLSGSEVRQLHQLAEEKSASLIHLYLGTEAARALPYLKTETRTKVVSFHGADLSESLAQSDLEGLIENVDLFLVRSHSLGEVLRQRGCPPERIRLNRTGVPVASIAPVKSLPTDRPLRLLQACRFISKKGLDVTLEACVRLKERGWTWRLDLLGDGPERASLEALAARLGIADWVAFPGFMPNAILMQRLPEYDLFLHPSRTTAEGDREGIPNALLEAMGQGIPVVSTRHSGIPEAITHRENGLLIERAGPEQLATEIDILLRDPDTYRRLSQGAYRRIKEEFSTESCIQSLEASYREAITLSAERH